MFRYRDPQLHVIGKYSHIVYFATKHLQILMFKHSNVVFTITEEAENAGEERNFYFTIIILQFARVNDNMEVTW